MPLSIHYALVCSHHFPSLSSQFLLCALLCIRNKVAERKGHQVLTIKFVGQFEYFESIQKAEFHAALFFVLQVSAARRVCN